MLLSMTVNLSSVLSVFVKYLQLIDRENIKLMGKKRIPRAPGHEPRIS